MIHSLQNGKFAIIKELGSGGFGITYEASNTWIGKRVAIKEFFMVDICERGIDGATVTVPLKTKHDLFKHQKERFIEEAGKLAHLKHQNIVSVFDYFEENGTAYFVMDYIDGESLANLLHRTSKPMEEVEVLNILNQVLDALAYIHEQIPPLFHLDIKPANLMLNRDGNVVLIDFGASKIIPQDDNKVNSTVLPYTRGFAPPEQMNQEIKKIGAWTDIYSLGATLYNLLTNLLPPLPSDIDDDTSDDKHVALPFPANVSEQTRKLVLLLMSTLRNKRPQSVRTVKNVLKKEEPLKEKEKEAPAGNCSKDDQHPHAVDLGLPSGTKWASCNVGAEKPEDYGDYFAWGETETKTVFSGKTSIFYGKPLPKEIYRDASPKGLFKQMSHLMRKKDKWGICGTSYDVAHVLWPGSWRLPTKDDVKELIEHCRHSVATRNGIQGMTFTGKNGQSIFLPFAGYRSQASSSPSRQGHYGMYWTGTPKSGEDHNSAKGLGVDDGGGAYINNSDRFFGRSVRPVIREDGMIPEGEGESPKWPSILKVLTAIALLGCIFGGVLFFLNRNEANVFSDLCPDSHHPHAIDLGLPSGAKWSCSNMGADKPNEYGDYYAWGETETKTDFSPSTSDYFMKSKEDICGTSDDVAHVKWGDSWHLPTLDDVNELLENCTHTVTTKKGCKGMLFTGKNGQSIFLPFAGYRNEFLLYSQGAYGYFWSGTPGDDDSNAYTLYIYDNGTAYRHNYYRFNGRSVRPVYNDKDTTSQVEYNRSNED